MSIYIPDELEAAMADYRDALNWSYLAQGAFQRAIKLEQLKEVSMEESQLQRLRESRAKLAEQEEAEGEAAGKEWALEVAEYDELRRVAELVESLGGDYGHLGAAGVLAEAAGYDNVAALGEAWFDTVNPSDEQVYGFIRGAAAVYAKGSSA